LCGNYRGHGRPVTSYSGISETAAPHQNPADS
jgi:hypothetical protein